MQEEILVHYDKRIKGFKKRDMLKDVWVKIAENLDFVKNSNFTGGKTAAPVRGCYGVNLQGNTRDGILLQ